jgi:hypothetical protein
MSNQILLSPSTNTLTVRFGRDFDLSAQRLLNTATQLIKRLRCRCVLDFAEVETVRDSGVALLLLLRRGLGADAEIRIVNCRQEHVERLRAHSGGAIGVAA